MTMVLISLKLVLALAISVAAQTTTRATTTLTTKTSTTKTTSTKTSTVSWQVSGGVQCPHPSVNTVWPTSAGSTTFPTASVIPPGAVFDGGMSLFDRAGTAGDCGGQAELDRTAAVFILEEGATLRNAIIGPKQAEGVHCLGACTIENVWWEDVCEDAATFWGDGPRYIRGGGAREASDKVFQHNGKQAALYVMPGLRGLISAAL